MEKHITGRSKQEHQMSQQQNFSNVKSANISGEITTDIFNKSFKIIVKPNSKKNQIVGFDKNKNAIRVDIKAPAENNKAQRMES